MFGLVDFLLDKTKQALYESINSYRLVKKGCVLYLVITTLGKIKNVSFEDILLVSKSGVVFERLQKEDLKIIQTEKSAILKINNPPPLRQFVVGEDEIKVKGLWLKFDTYEAYATTSFK